MKPIDPSNDALRSTKYKYAVDGTTTGYTGQMTNTWTWAGPKPKVTTDYVTKLIFTEKETSPMEAEKIILNEPATIVVWKDKTKTVVKCDKDDVYDPVKGIALCYMKKAMGNKGNYNNIFRRWIPWYGIYTRTKRYYGTPSLKDFSESLSRGLEKAIKEWSK